MPVYINDQFTDNEKATLHVSDLSIQRGFAVFDFCRTVNGVPLFLNDHLERFLHSAHAMRLQVPYTKPQLIDIIRGWYSAPALPMPAYASCSRVATRPTAIIRQNQTW